MDFYLTPENEEHWQAIQALATQESDEAFEKLMHYAMEGTSTHPALYIHSLS